MNIQDYLKGLVKTSKDDDIPGTTEETDELCPLCMGQLKIMKPCCTSTRREKVCKGCGWKSYLD